MTWPGHILLGLIQGITEWLPISSSGHLALAENLMQIELGLAYDLFLHLASLIVMLVYFRKDILKLVRSLAPDGSKEDRTMVGYIIVATVGTMLVALLIEPWEETMRGWMWLAGGMLINAAVLLATAFAKRKSVFTWQNVALIGVVQGIAAVPSISRSALTLSVALLVGIPRKQAFRFSFLIAIPALLAAMVFKLPDIAWRHEFIIGFIMVLISGYVSLGLLERLVRRDKFHWFWVYNLVIAIIIALYAGRF